MLWRTPSKRPSILPAGFIEPCNPSVSTKAPTGPQWIHEIKHDGYRLIVRREGARVRVFTRRGYDWTDRYPGIVHAAKKLRVTSATIDGEAVCCGPDGLVDFNKLHSRAYDDRVFLYAFDVLELNGTDLREASLGERKEKLEKLLRKAAWGLRYVEHWDGDGAVMFEQACKMNLEGIVSKRRDRPYLSGTSKSWLKVRNPASAAMKRYEDETF
jgi:ATP-dependent DNA ligase